jgi:hypothetical protein
MYRCLISRDRLLLNFEALGELKIRFGMALGATRVNNGLNN